MLWFSLSHSLDFLKLLLHQLLLDTHAHFNILGVLLLVLVLVPVLLFIGVFLQVQTMAFSVPGTKLNSIEDRKLFIL